MTTKKTKKKYCYEASYIAKSTRRVIPQNFKSKREAEQAIRRTGASVGIEIKRKELKGND